MFIPARKSAAKTQYRPTFYASGASSTINQQFFHAGSVGPRLWAITVSRFIFRCSLLASVYILGQLLTAVWRQYKSATDLVQFRRPLSVICRAMTSPYRKETRSCLSATSPAFPHRKSHGSVDLLPERSPTENVSPRRAY